MSAAASDPSSTASAARRRRLAAAAGLAAFFFLAVCSWPATALAGEAAPSPQPPAPDPQPPALGSPAPDIPLFDQNGREASLREALKERFVVLVFFIGYT